MVHQMSVYSMVVAAMPILVSVGWGAKEWGAEVTVSGQADNLILRWRGDEDIQVTLPATGGLWGQAFSIAVADQQLTFDGFNAVVNGKPLGEFTVVEQSSHSESNRVIYEQTLKHPDLEQPTSARIVVSMQPEDKAIRFEISVEGEGQKLDDLGVGRCHGEGLAAERLYFGTCVINGPIKSFSTGPRCSTNRYWTWELDNGLSLMQGTDMPPHRYVYEADDRNALFNLRTYSSVPITYRFVVTAKGGQEAFRQYSRSLGHQPTEAVKKLPGRCVFMAWYPIKDHLEWWYRELVGRGARHFIWLDYTNRPSDIDRRILDTSDSLYCPYTNYIDYFDPVADGGERLSPDWDSENCIYNADGNLQRGYHRSTRLLPNLYEKWATEGHMWKDFYNLREHVDIMGVNCWYFDVHASLYPLPYYNHEGNYYTQREWWQHTVELFALARKLGGDAPVFSECGCEWYAEAMDGGAFNATPGPSYWPSYWGIAGSDWEYYPNLDQVHRRWHLPVSCFDHGNYVAKDWGGRSWYQDRVALNVLFGRSELIVCYWDANLSEMDYRLLSYYLHSAFHKMLGNNGIHEIEFAEGNIHRLIVHYDHGATVYVNRREEPWEVEGQTLRANCYLIKGPDFEQYSVVPEGKNWVAEYVKSPDYWLFSAYEMHDFGAARVSGAYAVRMPQPDNIVVYQIRKTKDVISLHLPTILGRPGPYQLEEIYNVVDRRRVARRLAGAPILPAGVPSPRHWPAYEVRPSRIEDDWLIFEPAQDPHAWRYEIQMMNE